MQSIRIEMGKSCGRHASAKAELLVESNGARLSISRMSMSAYRISLAPLFPIVKAQTPIPRLAAACSLFVWTMASACGTRRPRTVVIESDAVLHNRLQSARFLVLLSPALSTDIFAGTQRSMGKLYGTSIQSGLTTL